jgi:demethylmenaquinone methyltransferase/2-methoxy-6-polyprenyl-1,4-benzoquinol methylase
MFKEQFRVLKPGGRIVCLDTSPIPDNMLKPFILIYYKFVIPFLGFLIAGEKKAYKYLPETTIGFLKPDALAGAMEEAGLKHVGFKSFMFGNIAVHWGIKP